MRIVDISDFTRGWFVGNFDPSLVKTEDFEVCYKTFVRGQSEAPGVQRIATEVTLVVDGKARINGKILEKGSVCLISPGESADFEAITDCAVIGIKFPSVPHDKVVN